jgi:hypothetical protein
MFVIIYIEIILLNKSDMNWKYGLLYILTYNLTIVVYKRYIINYNYDDMLYKE